MKTAFANLTVIRKQRKFINSAVHSAEIFGIFIPILRKLVHTVYIDFLEEKNENFIGNILILLLHFRSKHTLWVHVRIASSMFWIRKIGEPRASPGFSI